MPQVIKRDGSKQDFDRSKIVTAVQSAYLSVGRTCPESVLADLEHLQVFDGISVEEIQDRVENFLMVTDSEVAKAYIKYRSKQAELRAEEQFIDQRLAYMEDYENSEDNASESSETDPNANMSIKNAVSLESEVYKSKNRLIQRRRMKKQLTKMESKELGQQYIEDVEHHIIYPHDEASTPVKKPYCMAVTMFPLLQNGTAPLDGLKGESAPKNLDSFVGQFCNLVFLLSAQVKGAVAYGEFFNFLDYFIRKEYGEDYFKNENVYVENTLMPRRRTIGQHIDQVFQHITYYINQPAQNRGNQSPFTNFSVYDHNYWKAMFGDFYFPDGTQPVWESVSWLQKRYMRWLNAERLKVVLTFPVMTMNLLTDGKEVMDKEYDDFNDQEYAEGNSFFTYQSDNPDALSSCCRLRNAVEDNTFTFTNGLTGVQTGSCNVITLNLNRITQDWIRQSNCPLEDVAELWNNSPEDYKKAMRESFVAYLLKILDRVYKYHIAYKEMLYKSEKAGMFSAAKEHYISLKKLYSTIGLNGLNEAAEFLGMKVSPNPAYEEFCNLITTTIKEQNKAHKTDRFMFNTEMVPAESLSSKNYNWDKEDGYWVPEDRNLYNSYFYLAGDPQTTVLDRFKMHGKGFTGNLDGGVGLHCNLDDHLSKEQYHKLKQFAIANGVSYWTYNIPNSQCEDCNFILKRPFEVCPKCGSTHILDWTRIIGYLRPVQKYDDPRKWEAQHKRIYLGKETVKL